MYVAVESRNGLRNERVSLLGAPHNRRVVPCTRHSSNAPVSQHESCVDEFVDTSLRAISPGYTIHIHTLRTRIQTIVVSQTTTPRSVEHVTGREPDITSDQVRRKHPSCIVSNCQQIWRRTQRYETTIFQSRFQYIMTLGKHY